MNQSVQEELKLTREQAEKVSQFQEKTIEKIKEGFAKLQDARPEERREKFHQMMKEVSQDAEKMVKEVLKPEQARRLKQIQMQQAGVENFTRAEIQRLLRLTDEQKDKLTALAEDTRKDSQAILREARRDPQKMPEARKRVETLKREAMEKANAVLTDEQRKLWKDLLGEPFEMKFERSGFRPGR
ncbi:MAG TPA: Spy/CpxP family protein refolding chaperone [Gemmataceae bacterium]|nr:Spy/CpxP family protein refolding chaperone [Gemmataceae bacterium]